MGKSNELGQLATLVSVDSASDNIFFGPTIAPTVSIDTNAGIITSTTFIGTLTGNVNGSVTGNVNGSVTGNVNGNVTGNLTGSVDLSGLLKESVNIVDNNVSSSPIIYLQYGMVHYYSVTETANATPNIRYSPSTSINSVMDIGETISVTLITRPNSTYYTQLLIDSVSVTEEWLGGFVPSAQSGVGVLGSYDIYTYNIIKTANASYLVLANKVNFT